MLRKVLSIAGAVAILAFVGFLIYTGSVSMPDYWTGVAVGLTLVAFGIIYWGFKPEIHRLIKAKKDSWQLTPKGFPAELVIEDIHAREITEEETGIKQKRFALRVSNKGSMDARKCKATLTLTKVSKDGESTPREFRLLVWEGEPPPTEQTIRANDEGYVLLVFSDSRFSGRAFACKFNTLYNDRAAAWLEQNRNVVMKDSFEMGDYEAILEIKALDNVSTAAKLRIHVDNYYPKTSTELLDTAIPPSHTSHAPAAAVNHEPTLKVVKITKNNEPAYHLRVSNEGKQGAAEDCEAKLAVENTSISNTPAVWAGTHRRKVNITTSEDLRLFSVELLDPFHAIESVANRSASDLPSLIPEGNIERKKYVVFPSAHEDRGFARNPKPYDAFVQKELVVYFGAKIGRFTTNPYRKKIIDIINEAVEEKDE